MNNFTEILQSIVSKTVSSSTVGGGAGSIIKLEVETEDFIFVYCAWRLEYNGIVLSTSEDDSYPITGLMASTIKRLEGTKVIKIECSPQYDLTIFFEGAYILRIFCDQSSSEGDFNWDLCSPRNDIAFTVNNRFQIDITAYYSNSKKDKNTIS